MNLEDFLFAHITNGMGITFIGGILCLFLYAWVRKREYQEGYSANVYMRLNLPNILFHMVASFVVLIVLHEISGHLISNFIPTLEGSGTYNMTLAGLVGMFGSPLVARILEFKRRRLNLKDRNLEHKDPVNRNLENQ